MRDRLDAALRAGDADYIEIRVEESEATSIAFRGEELDHAGASSAKGGIVRAMTRGGWGQSVFNDLDDLPARVREACDASRLVGHETTQLAEVEPVVAETRASLLKDFRGVPLARKKEVIESYNRLVLGFDDKIQTSAISYSDRFRTVTFANSEGSYIVDERPYTSISIGATARDGDNVQREGFGAANWVGFEIAEDREQDATDTARKAVELLSAPPIEGGKYTVVIDPHLAGVFAHEAFGHLSEADFVYENKRMQEVMRLGKRFGPESLNILDDGSIEGQAGTRLYDDEGVKTRKNYLIREGELVGRLHSRETAAKLGEPVTGNARAIGQGSPPIVRMTNTYIDQGGTSFDEMIGDIELGVYAVDAFGGQTALEMFTFSARRAYMIRDGKVTELVRDVVLTGNVFETLANIEAIGDDLFWPERGGGCGKGGQSPLPVGIASPHLRVRDMVVGGRQS